LPQPAAERHHLVGIIDQQRQRDKRFFQAHGRPL
jgi:hypothetical protein